MIDTINKMKVFAEIVLNGEKIVLEHKSLARTGAFRKELTNLLDPIVKKLGSGQFKASINEDGNPEVSPEELFKMIPEFLPYVISNGLDVLIQLPFLYNPELEKYKDLASDEELIDAGIEVIKASFPLVQMLFQKMMSLSGTAEETESI